MQIRFIRRFALRRGHDRDGAEGRKHPMEAGLAQLALYLAGLSLSTGWLVIFDQRSGLAPIADRTTVERVKSANDREIVLIRG